MDKAYVSVLLAARVIICACIGAGIPFAVAGIAANDVGYLWQIGAVAAVAWAAIGVCLVFRRRWLRREFPLSGKEVGRWS